MHIDLTSSTNILNLITYDPAPAPQQPAAPEQPIAPDSYREPQTLKDLTHNRCLLDRSPNAAAQTFALELRRAHYGYMDGTMDRRQHANLCMTIFRDAVACLALSEDEYQAIRQDLRTQLRSDVGVVVSRERQDQARIAHLHELSLTVTVNLLSYINWLSAENVTSNEALSQPAEATHPQMHRDKPNSLDALPGHRSMLLAKNNTSEKPNPAIPIFVEKLESLQSEFMNGKISQEEHEKCCYALMEVAGMLAGDGDAGADAFDKLNLSQDDLKGLKLDQGEYLAICDDLSVQMNAHTNTSSEEQVVENVPAISYLGNASNDSWAQAGQEILIANQSMNRILHEILRNNQA